MLRRRNKNTNGGVALAEPETAPAPVVAVPPFREVSMSYGYERAAEEREVPPPEAFTFDARRMGRDPEEPNVPEFNRIPPEMLNTEKLTLWEWLDRLETDPETDQYGGGEVKRMLKEQTDRHSHLGRYLEDHPALKAKLYKDADSWYAKRGKGKRRSAPSV